MCCVDAFSFGSSWFSGNGEEVEDEIKRMKHFGLFVAM